TTQMDAYAIGEACDSLREYADLLTNWYVRGSRDRFWAEDATAFNVLYTVLETVLRLAAPLMPMVGEEIWRGLTGGRSVHLEPWPDLAPASAPMATEAGNDSAPAGRVFSGSRLAAAACDKETALDQALPMDAELMEAMDRVREVCSATLALRKAAQIRVRQPLRQLVVADSAVDRLAPFLPLIQAEVNVKQIELLENSSEVAAAHGVATRLEVNARAAGPRLGKAVQAVIQAVKAGSWVSDDAGRLVVETSAGPVELLEGEYTRRTVVDQDSSGRQRTAGVLAGGGFVLLDLELDDELKAEGYARDLVRLVQDQRKAQGLHVSDRIELELAVPAERVPQVEAHAAMIQAETLSVTLKVALGSGDAVQATITKVPQP
ncbi:MAG: DUF5915 domain-containing protein, partial [Micrococcales bacterium]|nr:DUF5915 domain-containing protein [Micrococcales bacterium]